MWQAILAFLQVWSSANKVVEKALPSERIQEGKFDLAQERLTIDERTEILRHSKRYLTLHLRQSVDAFVNVAYDKLSSEDKEDLRQALYELFPKRKYLKT